MNRIGIRINGTNWLELSDTELDVTLVSPVFSDKAFEENSVYNFTIPDTPKNSATFGNPKRAMTFSKAMAKYRIEIFYENLLVGDGTAFVAKTSRKSFEIVTALNESSFFALFGDKYITEFLYGGERVYYAQSDTVHSNMIVNCAGKSLSEQDFAYFPVRNTELYSAYTGHLLNDAYWNAGSFSYITGNRNRPYQNDYIDTNYLTRDTFRPNNLSITPFPYMAYIIESIFTENGYTVLQNDFAKDSDLSKICIYNPNISPVKRESMNNSLCYIKLNEHLPKLKVAEFLTAAKSVSTAVPLINENLKTASIVTFNNLKDSRIEMPEYLDEVDLGEPKKLKFNLEVDGSDSYNNAWQKPDEIEKHNNRGTFATVADLSTISSPLIGDMALVTNDNYFYQFNQTWEKSYYNIQNVYVGSSEEIETIASNYSSAYSERIATTVFDGPSLQNDIAVDSWDLCEIDMPGNIRLGGLGPNRPYNDFDLKLLLNWGMAYTNTYIIDYPTGSGSGIKYGNYDPPSRNFGLIPNHPNSYVDKFHNRINKSKMHMKVKKILTTMRISELKEIDFLRSVRSDGRLWLISKVNFKLSNSGISPVEMELTEIE